MCYTLTERAACAEHAQEYNPVLRVRTGHFSIGRKADDAVLRAWIGPFVLLTHLQDPPGVGFRVPPWHAV